MTYNEWRDELKSNLLSVSPSERRRVLDYYAEAYADRRDAGYTEREIIEDFGAPYDAAQRILSDRPAPSYDYFDDDYDARRSAKPRENDRREREERRAREREERRESRENRKHEKRAYDEYDEYERRYPERDYENRRRADPPKDNSHPILFAILCILFGIPMFGVFMALVGITIGLCSAPFAAIIAGCGSMGAGIGQMVGGHLYEGLATLGTGAVVFGIGLILIPAFFTVVKYLWKMLKHFFSWMKSLLNDGRRYI